MWWKIKFVGSRIWEFLAPLIRQLMTKAGPNLITAAEQAVTAIEESMSGSASADKRQAAFDLIISSLKSQGIALATATINAALEAAVVKMTGK
jgi:hypothetical protein